MAQVWCSSSGAEGGEDAAVDLDGGEMKAAVAKVWRQGAWLLWSRVLKSHTRTAETRAQKSHSSGVAHGCK